MHNVMNRLARIGTFIIIGPLYAQNVGIGTASPANRLHIDAAPPANANSGQLRISESDNGRFMLLGRTGSYGFIQTHNLQPLSLNPLGNNVGISTTDPQQRLHVNGKAIVHDGTTGTPQPSTWGTDGSRLILWPGTSTAHPYQIGIAAGTLWYGVPRGAQYSFYHGENEVFAITPTTRNVVNVGGNTNFPSIWLGRLNDGFNNAGPYPTRGTFLFFGGPTNNFVTNTGPVVMYFAHLGSDISRLRLHVEDNSPGNSPVDGFSIMGGSCGSGGCNNLNLSQLF